MDISGIIAEVETTLATQMELAGGDPAVDAAAAHLFAVLEPALNRAAMSIAEQAAAEIGAQLPDGDIDLIVKDGQPILRYRASEPSTVAYSADDLHARLTLRLPEVLKAQLEEAAGTVGDSLNAYVIKSLADRRSTGRRGNRMSGTIET